MESGSVVSEALVNAPSGTELADVAVMEAFGVVPENVPPDTDDPAVDVVPASTVAGTVSTPDEGV